MLKRTKGEESSIWDKRKYPYAVVLIKAQTQGAVTDHINSCSQLFPFWPNFFSCALYGDWGAFGKVDQMRYEYEFLASSSSSTGGGGSDSRSSTGSSQKLSSSLKGVSRYDKHLSDSMKTFSITNN